MTPDDITIRPAADGPLTVGQVADRLQAPEWLVRRIVDSLGPVPRAGQYRLIPPHLLGRIAERVRAWREDARLNHLTKTLETQ